MTLSDRTLWWLYLLAAGLTARCAVTSACHGAYWRAVGLFGAALLLLVALAREYIAADERRAAAVRAERAARLRARAAETEMRRAADALALDRTCCEHWWTSCGTQHTRTCKSQRRPV